MKLLSTLGTVVALILISHFGYTQNVRNTEPPLTLSTNETGKFVFDTVVNVNGVSKGELYKRTKSWITSNIRTSDNTVILDDKDSSEIKTDATLDLERFGNFSN